MDKNKINISILGAGKLSWHLAEAIADSGIIINEIYSRNLKSAKKLVEKILQGKATTDKDFTKSSSDIFILALPDDVTIGRDLTVTRNLSATGNLTVGAGGTVITTVVGAAASIGIGDASPSYMLDVAGAINSQTDVKVNGVSVTEQALNDAVAMAIALG